MSALKSEVARPPPQFCLGCFSMDRTLWPLGELLDVFYSLVEYQGTTIPPCNCLCWECLAVLRRVSHFKRNAAAVQAFLYHHHINKSIPIPSPLTRLGSVRGVSKEIAIDHEAALPGPQPDEIKTEPALSPGPPDLCPLVYDEVKQEIDDDDWQNDDIETKETPEDLPQPAVAVSINKRDKTVRTSKPRSYKYIRKAQSNLCIQKFYTKVPVNDAELQKLLEKDRRDKLFLKLPNRCELCLCGWKDSTKLALHNKQRHSADAGALQCAVCSARVAHKAALTHHVRAHYLARQCAACPYRSAAQNSMRRHVLKYHVKSVKCRACGTFVHNVREFFRHYAALHRQFICDHCGKRCATRASIKKHLAKHGPFVCRLCPAQTFKSRSSLAGHRATKHPPALTRLELAYCVECDKQFHSVAQFRKHLASAKAHRKLLRKKQIPCPVCGKIYARTTSMRAHYNYVHLKRSNYACRECDLLFLNRTKYVAHMRRKHVAGYQAPRDKLCTLCGRGFSTNRVLENHMRTHTGERPFACTHCEAKFSQKVALKTHVKHIHLKEKRQPAPQLKYFD